MRVFIEETGKIQKVLAPLKAFNPIEGDDVDKVNGNNGDCDDGNLGIEWWHMKA